MTNKTEQFLGSARELKLTNKEKTEIRQSVLNFIKNNPVYRERAESVSSVPEVRPGFWSNVNIFLFKPNFITTMSIVLVIALLLGGGAGLAAEKALPGDVLYPVKVGINEEVKGWLMASDEAKANWEIERTHRRLEEAEKLAAEGSLNAETRAVIESNFQVHSERVADRITKLETKENFNSAADVSSNFESSLVAHEKILNKLLEKEVESGSKKEIKPIVNQVKTAVKSVKTNRKKNEQEISARGDAKAEIAAEGKLKAAENKLEEAKKYVESANSLSAEARFEAEAKLEAARTTIDYGKDKLDAGDSGTAFNSFQQAIRIAQEAKLLIVASQNLKLDIRIGDNVGGDVDGDREIDEDERDYDDDKDEDELRIEIEERENVRLDLGL